MNFGVFIFSGQKLIFQALPGTSASTAWLEGDTAYNQIIDQNFEAITSDDNCPYNIGRNKIRRLKSLKEFNELLNSENTCETFRNQIITWLTN